MAPGETLSWSTRVLAWAGVCVGLLAATAEAALEPPRNLRADAPYGERIDLSWQAAGAEVEGYRVARRCGGDENEDRYCERARLGPDVHAYRDWEVEAGKVYAYRVESIQNAESAAAYARVSTPEATRLPRDSRGKSEPLYFEPQGAWSLGQAVSLAPIHTVRIGHNLARDEDLRILLKAPGPADPKAPCRAHSLLGRLQVADFKTARVSVPSQKPPGRTAEVYFIDLTRESEGDPWIREQIPEFESMGPEGYALRAEFVAPGSLRILVGAKTPKGLFRGGMTVQRLLVDDSLCAARKELEPVVVLDYPDHPFRGANAAWPSMTANRTQVPEEDLDMLDALARSGATEVDWGSSWAAQEGYSWNKTGARAAAAVQMAAADRFMTVKYWMGSSAIGFGTTDKGSGVPGDEPRVSLSQSVYGDGLAVVDEPFWWMESEPGRFEAQAQRAGRLLVRDADMVLAPVRPTGGVFRGRPVNPWRSGKCADSESWQFEEASHSDASGATGWKLEGPARDCTLSQSVTTLPPSVPGGYFLSARVRVSDEAVGAHGSLELQVTTQGGVRRWALPLPEDREGHGWTEVARVIPASEVGESVISARLVLTGSVGEGNLAVDRVGLYARSVAPFRMRGESGWSIHSNRSGLAWDRSHGRTDSRSFRVEGSGQARHGGAPPRASLKQEILLDGGLYILGAWMQVDSGHARTSGKGSFSVSADIKVEFFADGEADQDDRLVAEHLNFPRVVKGGAGRWIYYIHVFRLPESEARRVRSVRIQLRSFDSGQDGGYWVDDIELLRLDGDLRNLLGAVQPPVLKTASGQTYVEGRDYEVCQVGTSGSQCGDPENYTELLQGGLTSSYDVARPPFEIRWLGEEGPVLSDFGISYDISAQYSSVSTPVVGWDGQVYTPGSLNFCDFDKVVAGIGLEAIFGRFLDGYPIQDFPRKGEEYLFKADTVTWSVSEVEGMNRSVACRRADGTWRHSNAALFAQVVNRAFSLAKKKSPKTRFVLWADMFDPFHNGGDLDFQVRYGGVPGRSACSFAPSRLKSMCAEEVAQVSEPIVENDPPEGEGIIMQPWTYFPDAVRRMVAISSWYEELGVTSQVLTGSDPINIEDWAGIAHAFDGVKGVLSNRYHADRYEGRSGVLSGLQAFWRHDWKLLYLHDHEDSSSSFYTIPWPFKVSAEWTRARREGQGNCSAGSGKFKKNNDGGLCLLGSPSTGPSRISLSGIPAQGGRFYRVDVLARRRSKGSYPIPGPAVAVTWSTGQQDSVASSDLVFDAERRGRKQGFSRYRAGFEAPSGAEAMRIEVEFSEDGAFKAADDILIFESRAACFDGCARRD